MCHFCNKKMDITKINLVCWNTKKNKLKAPNAVLETKTVAPITSSRTTATKTTTTTIKKTEVEQKEGQKLITSPVRQVEKQTIPQRNAILEQMQTIDCLPET